AYTHVDRPAVPTRRSSDLAAGTNRGDKSPDHVQFAPGAVRLHVPAHPERQLPTVVERRHGLVVVRPEHPGAGDVTETGQAQPVRSEEHTSELQSPDHLVCR